MIGKKAMNWSVLIIHLLVILLYHNLVYTGHYGFDDMEYAEAAVDLLKGQPDYSNHFSHRLSVTAPTAVAFALVGINDTGAALPALVFSFLIALLLSALLWKKGPFALSIGLSLALLPQWFLFYTDKLMPDMAVAFFVFAAVAAYWWGTQNFGKRKMAFAIAFSLSLLFGFLAKGTIVLALPWVLVIFLIDMHRKREKAFWIAAIGSGAVLFVIYFLVNWWITGSISSRFIAIAGNAYLNACSYADLPPQFLLERVATGFWKMGIKGGLLPGMIFLLAGLIGKRFRLSQAKPTLLSFSLITGAVFLLSANFMTISPTSYNPMCLDVRHYLFLTPVLALPSALVFSNFVSEGRNRFSLPIIGIFFALAAYFIDFKEFEKLWLPLSGVILIGSIPVVARKAQALLPVLVFGIMLILPWEMLWWSDQVKYSEQKAWTIDQLKNLESGSTIYTSPVQERLTRYYLGFDTTDIKVRRYSSLEEATIENRQSFLLFNPYTLKLSGLNVDELPYTARYPQETSVLIARDETTQMELYKIQDIVSPTHTGERLISIVEDFENTESRLEFSPENYVNRADRTAYRIGEYSATLRVPYDSTSAFAEKQVFAIIEMEIYAESQGSPRLVISIEKNGESLYREEKYLLRQGTIYGAWNTVKTEFRLPYPEGEDSELLLYIWNPEKQEVFIDSMEIVLKDL
ncbi:MAG TPA: hypothetical protein VJ949_14145 [Cryomorphaceae bacterium]|nr:hypothetical protein [Cryomorphaceae bacterium]